MARDDGLRVYGLRLPVIEGPADLGELVVKAAEDQGVGIADGDVITLSSKLVAKAEGSVIKLEDVKPSEDALRLAEKVGEDPRFVELVLRESDRVLAVIPMLKLVEEGIVRLENVSKNPNRALEAIRKFPVLFLVWRDRSLWTDAGIDSSNLPEGYVSIPPRNLDQVAKKVRERIRGLTGKEVAVVICDTEGFLGGSLDIARGSYGIEPRDKCFGDPDLYGKPKFGGVDLIVHEVCAASALIARQTNAGIPATIIRGLKYERCECGLRDKVMIDPSRAGEALKLIIKHTLNTLGTQALTHTLK